MAKLPKKAQIGWQVFRRREATSEYITQSGMCIDLVRFDALCATCGQPFMAKATKTRWRRKQLSRRCERHRAPGVYVNNDRPPVSVAEMPWWAKPARWARGGSGKVRRAPGTPRKPLVRPAEPALPSYLD